MPVTKEGVTSEADGREIMMVAGGKTINEAGQPVVVVDDGQKVMTDHEGHHFVVIKGGSLFPSTVLQRVNTCPVLFNCMEV